MTNQGEACPPDNSLDDLRADHLSDYGGQGAACAACAKIFHSQVEALVGALDMAIETFALNERLPRPEGQLEAWIAKYGDVTDYEILVRLRKIRANLPAEAARKAQAHDEMAVLLEALCNKLDEVTEATVGIFTIAALHHAPYGGPTYEHELKAARAALAKRRE